MAPFSRMAVFARPSHERQLLTLRYLQVIIGLGYIVAIAATNADTGKWSYESIELATAFGGKQPTKSPLTTQTRSDLEKQRPPQL